MSTATAPRKASRTRRTTRKILQAATHAWSKEPQQVLFSPSMMRPLSAPQKKDFLNNAAKRAKHLLGHFGATLAPQFEAAALAVDDESKQRDMAQRQLAALKERLANGGRTDGPINVELAAMNVLTINNFMWATSNWGAFFEIVNLADDEEPWISNETKVQSSFLSINEDGTPVMDKAPLLAGTETRVPLHMKASKEYVYPLIDLYRGDIRMNGMLNLDLARDLREDFEAARFALIDAAFAAFDVASSDKQDRTYVANDRVKSGNIPTTNNLLPSDDNTSSTKWRLTCLKALVHYEAKLSALQSMDGTPIRFSTIFLPSADVTNFIDTISESTESNPITQQIFDNGYVMTIGGRSYNLVGDATLDPALGYAYALSNKPIGRWYAKPGLDGTFINNSAEMQRSNREGQWMRTVHGSAVPKHWKMNAARIRYRDDS